MPLSQCGVVVNWPIYLPLNSTVKDLDALAAAKNAYARFHVEDTDFAESMMLFTCSEVFQKCETIKTEGRTSTFAQYGFH